MTSWLRQKELLIKLAASGMVAVSSGAVEDFTVLEAIDLNAIGKIASKMVSGYKEPAGK